MSNGRFLVRSLPNPFAATIDAADRGEKTVKFWTGFSGYYEPAHVGRICPIDFRHDLSCHRRFQLWVRDGTLKNVLETIAEDLRTRGELDLSECFTRGTFVTAKKGASKLEKPSGALGTKIMAVADRAGFPLAIYTDSASPLCPSNLSEKLSPKFLPANFPVNCLAIKLMILTHWTLN